MTEAHEHCWHFPEYQELHSIQNPDRWQYCCWCGQRRLLRWNFAPDPAHGSHFDNPGSYQPVDE